MLYDTDRWLAWNQPSNIQMIVLPLEAAMVDLPKRYGHSWPLTILIFDQDQVYWLNRWEELRSLGEKILDSLLMPGATGHFFDKEFPELSAKLAVEIEVTLKALYASAESSHVRSLYEEFRSTYRIWYGTAWCAEPLQFAIEQILGRELDRLNRLRRVSDEDVVQGKVHLFSPAQLTYQAQIQKSLAECAESLAEAAGFSDEIGPIDIRSKLSSRFDCANADLFEKIILGRPAFAKPLELLNQHQQAFYWKKNNYLRTVLLRTEDIFHEACEMLTIGGLRQIREDVQHLSSVFSSENETRRRLYDALEDYHKRLVDILGKNALLKDSRKASIQGVNHVVTTLMERLCDLYPTLTLELALQLLPQEVLEVLEVGVNPALLETLLERRHSAVVFWGEEDTSPLDFTSLRVLRSAPGGNYPPLCDWKMSAPTIVEGSAMSPMLSALNGKFRFILDMDGKVPSESVAGDVVKVPPPSASQSFSGVVRVLLSAAEGQVFHPGDILVAPSTTPDYLEYIQKAGCIVTDWGGWTSHAALVAREFNKPCIVGTQHASKIFASGDRVTIDFETGTIRKLKS